MCKINQNNLKEYEMYKMEKQSWGVKPEKVVTGLH